MSKRFAVVFDFDRTLFNTDEFNRMRMAYFKGQGIPEEIFWKTYHQTRLPVYNLYEHARLMAKSILRTDKINDKPLIYHAHRFAQDLFNLTYKLPATLVFPYVGPMLDEIKRQQDIDAYILSQGDWTYQNRKISGSGLLYQFGGDKIFITAGRKGPFFPYLLNQYERVMYYDDMEANLKDAVRCIRRAKLDVRRMVFMLTRHSTWWSYFRFSKKYGTLKGTVNTIQPSDLEFLTGKRQK